MRDTDVAPYATLIGASTPLLIAIAAGVWKVWEKVSRRKASPAEAEPEPAPSPSWQSLDTAFVKDLQNRLARKDREWRALDREKDWWRDQLRDHYAREHQDRPLPEYPKEPP